MDRHKAQVVSQHVDAVVLGQADTDLEFSGQIIRSVNRFFNRLKVCDVFLLAGLLVAEPEIEVSVRAWTQMLSNAIGECLVVATNRVAVDRSGQHMTLRFTSPQAARVVSLMRLISRIVSRRFPFKIP